MIYGIWQTLLSDNFLPAILTGGIYNADITPKLSSSETPQSFPASRAGCILPQIMIWERGSTARFSNSQPKGTETLTFQIDYYADRDYRQIRQARERVYWLLHCKCITPLGITYVKPVPTNAPIPMSEFTRPPSYSAYRMERIDQSGHIPSDVMTGVKFYDRYSVTICHDNACCGVPEFPPYVPKPEPVKLETCSLCKCQKKVNTRCLCEKPNPFVHVPIVIPPEPEPETCKESMNDEV